MENNARNFPGNGGQVVKEFLKEKNVDFSRLHYNSMEHSDDRVRRCKRKVYGTGISMPCDPTNQAAKKELKRLANEGKYTLGDLIVSQTFKKMILNEGLSLTIVEVNTLGRKHHLSLIREKLNKNKEEYFRVFTDDELNRMNEYDQLCSNDELKTKLKIHQRRRFLLFWQDGATISNLGHILMVNTVYDKAIYMTNEEYCLKYGYHKDVQAEIEKPEVFVRCPSNDQQMLYTDTRNEDHKMTRYPTKILGEIASQVETCQQKGGGFPCWICPVDIHKSYDVPYIYTINLSWE